MENFSVLQSPCWLEGMLHQTQRVYFKYLTERELFQKALISPLTLSLAEWDLDWYFLKQATKDPDLKSWHSSCCPRSGDVIETGFR